MRLALLAASSALLRTGAAPVLRSVMRVGDVEVINPSTIHRGSPNRTHQPRCVLSFTFQPAARLVILSAESITRRGHRYTS